MEGMVFSGFQTPNLEGYDVVVYLMKGIDVFDKIEQMRDSYHYMISDWDSPYLKHIMSTLGLTDEDGLYDLMIRSKMDFVSFFEMAAKEYPKVNNILDEMASFKKVFKNLSKRKKCTVIIGDSSNRIVSLYFERSQMDQVKVVDGIKYFYSKSGRGNSFITIDGNSLIKFETNHMSPDVLFFISSNQNGCFLPEGIDPLYNSVFMPDDIAEGIIVVGNSPILFNL